MCAQSKLKPPSGSIAMPSVHKSYHLQSLPATPSPTPYRPSSNFPTTPLAGQLKIYALVKGSFMSVFMCHVVVSLVASFFSFNLHNNNNSNNSKLLSHCCLCCCCCCCCHAKFKMLIIKCLKHMPKNEQFLAKQTKNFHFLRLAL